MQTSRCTPEIIAAALQELETRKANIEALLDRARAMLGGKKRGRPRKSVVKTARKGQRNMTAAGRKAISQAQKRRWKEYHRQKAAKPTTKA